MLLGSRIVVGIRVRIEFGVWLVSGHAHTCLSCFPLSLSLSPPNTDLLHGAMPLGKCGLSFCILLNMISAAWCRLCRRNGMSPWRPKSNRVVDTSTSVMLHDPHLVEMSAQLK